MINKVVLPALGGTLAAWIVRSGGPLKWLNVACAPTRKLGRDLNGFRAWADLA